MAGRTATRSKTRTSTPRTRNRTSTAQTPPAQRTPETAAAKEPAPLAHYEADPRIADLHDRAADMRDLAADILGAARTTAAAEVAALIRTAEEQADAIRHAAAVDRRKAQEDADNVRAHAARSAKDTAKTGEERAQALLADAEQRANKLAELRQASAEAAYRNALADAARILGEAQEQASEIKAARAAVETETDLHRRRALLELDEELAARRGEIEGELAELKEKVRREAEDEAEAIRAQAEQEAGQLGERAAAEALHLRREEEDQARAAVADIRREADQILKEARETRAGVGRELATAQEQRQLAEQRAAKLDRSRNRGEVVKEASIWVALTAVILLTASGEWQFARLVGLGDTPIGDAAWALPVGLDVYAITAFRTKRDVPFALGLMAATNITYHVADMTGAGMNVVDGRAHPSVWLIVVAVIVVIAIVWRVHRLLEDGHDEPAPAPPRPVTRRVAPPPGCPRAAPATALPVAVGRAVTGLLPVPVSRPVKPGLPVAVTRALPVALPAPVAAAAPVAVSAPATGLQPGSGRPYGSALPRSSRRATSRRLPLSPPSSAASTPSGFATRSAPSAPDGAARTAAGPSPLSAPDRRRAPPREGVTRDRDQHRGIPGPHTPAEPEGTEHLDARPAGRAQHRPRHVRAGVGHLPDGTALAAR